MEQAFSTIREAAKKGRSSVTLLVPLTDERWLLLAQKISDELWKKGFKTEKKSVRYDDDGPLNNELVASWGGESKRR